MATIKKKLTRKQFLTQQDEFITFSVRISNLLRDNQNMVLVIGGIVLGIVLFTGMIYFYQGNVKEEAKALEQAAYNVFHGRVEGENEAQARPGAQVFASREELYKTAKEKYQELLNQYPDTHNAKRARFYIGTCAYHLEEYKQAKKIFQEFLEQEQYKENDVWYFEAMRSLGYSQEGAKEYMEAAQTFQKLISSADEESKMLLYLDLARVYEQAQAWSQAKQTYETMQAMAGESDQQEILEEKLKLVEAKMAAQ